MFTTTQPLTIGSQQATQAYVVIHYAPIVTNGNITPTVLFRGQRVLVGSDGTITPVGPLIDKPFTAAQLTAARASNTQLDSALTTIAAALDTLAPFIGL